MSVMSFPEGYAQAGKSEPAPRGAQSGNVSVLWMACPWSEAVTDYDKRHIYIYATLLYHEAEGADEEELANLVFGLNLYKNRERALTVLHSHMKRAHWLALNHFPMLSW